jgi:hypothetical protein
MRLSFTVMVSPIQDIHTFGHMMIHEVVQSVFHHGFLVDVWYGILGGLPCGSHFMKGGLTAASYRYFLENELQLHFSSG